jgi:hypothetical protein
MKSNRKSPIWPYLLVLAGLFVLSVVAPRGWQAKPAVRSELARRHSPARPDVAKSSERPIVLRATTPHNASGRIGVEPLRIEPVKRSSAAPGFPGGDASFSFPLDEPADRPSDTENRVASQPSPAANSPAANENFSFVSLDGATAPDRDAQDDEGHDELPSDEESALTGESHIATEPSPRQVAKSAAPATGPEIDGEPSPDYDHWPLPVALFKRLERLDQDPATHAWATNVRATIDRLKLMRIDDRPAKNILQDLRQHVQAAPLGDMPAATQREFERAKLDLVRRLDLWEQAAAAATHQQFIAQAGGARDERMHGAASAVAELVAAAPVGQTWREYLMLERIGQLSAAVDPNTAEERRRLASTVLARMHDDRLSQAQRAFLANGALVEFQRRLQVWAVEPLPVGQLLHTVEAYEQARVVSLGQALAEQSAVLVESAEPAERRLGEEIERHYRNANLRLVVTRELLNRLLPQPQPAADPVNDTIVGVPTHGMSTTSTKLSLRLFPAEDQIRLGIEASGVVDSQTTSTSGPVTLHSTGASTYFVGKLVVLGREGLRVGGAMAEADAHSRLSGMETDFDGVPLVRNLVRGYALSEHDQKLPEASHQVEAKVAAKASQRLDAEVNARLIRAEADFQHKVLARIARLDLQSTVVQLTTTEDRVTARLRLAGDDQVGAHTPRPLALSNSLASLQIHESAINNALDGLQLADKTFTLPELHRWITERIDRPDAALPDDLPEDVLVTFAAKDPVRVRCVDGRVEVTVAIAELDDGRRGWYDFQVTVYYHPRREGLRLEFFRDGPIELTGEAYAGRAVIGLRGIFAKVFSSRRTLKIEPQIAAQHPRLATLEFNSAMVDNGWISVSVADRNESVGER